MRIVSADITGSLILNGVDVTDSFVSSSVDSGSFTQKIDSLQSSTSSLNSFTSSINTTIKNKLDSETVISGSIQVNITGTTGYSTFSSSISSSVGSLSSSVATTTSDLSSSIGGLSSSVATTTSNLSSSVGSLSSSVATTTLNLSSSVSSSIGDLSGSVATTTSNLSSGVGNLSSSVATTTSDLSSSIGSLSSSVATNTSGLSGRITTIEGNYATTGSNVFVGSQVITGSLYITTDLIVQGSSSLQNITASAVSIGTNTVILNTDTPAVRFAGISVQDSGSNVGVTGSIFWDGLCNRWVYSNPSGIGYSGGLLISGPRNTGTLGDEVGTTACMLMVGQGGDHITSSAIYTDSTITCIGNNKITGNFNVLGNSCLGNGNFYVSTDSTFTTDKVYTFRDAIGISNPNGLSYCPSAVTVLSVGSMGNGNSIITTGHVGVGTACPTVRLQVIGTIATGEDATGWGRITFDTDVVKVQASKNGVDPIGISFWTQSSGGAFAERMRIACDGKIGIGTTSPSAELQVNKNCDTTVAISNCVGVTSGNRGALAWYNCATSTVAMIRAAAVTDNVGTELQFHTRPSGGSIAQVMTLDSSGRLGLGTLIPNASLSINACKSLATVSGQACISSGVNDTGCIFFGLGDANSSIRVGMYGMQSWNGSFTDYTTKFTLTKGGVGNIDWLSVNNNGFASFTCQISTPTIIANNSFGFAACITSCSTDYSMYIRNMSSGFPLSIYTVGDSNGVNDDLKAIKIARSSNDNQFLALSLIYGGFGYGYKLAPRYYNGAAYVCGNPIVIDGYGNVGINCTAPYMPLTVAGCAGIDKLVINCTGFNSFGEHLQVRGCARFFGGHLRVSSGGGDGNYVFLTHNDVDGYLCICRTVYSGNLILSPFGGVGINTSVVSSKLSVNSGINTSTATVMTLQQATNGAVKDAAGFGLAINNGGESTNAADLIISTATAGALCERMRITSGGSVGINNSSPDTNSRLDVNGQAFVARLAVYNDNGTPSLGTSPTLYSPASATLGISMGTAERVRISTVGTCFSCLVYTPAICQPTGFVVYSFPINYGSSFVDVSSGNYLSLGGTEPGTINTYCAYAHGGITPRAVAANTEGMSWTCLRFVLRVLSPVGDVSTTPTYLQTAGYFYATGWYGICTCTNIGGVMDGSRGYSTVVLPWIPFSAFQNAGDVTGFGIRNVGPTTTRIGSVFIQYK